MDVAYSTRNSAVTKPLMLSRTTVLHEVQLRQMAAGRASASTMEEQSMSNWRVPHRANAGKCDGLRLQRKQCSTGPLSFIALPQYLVRPAEVHDGRPRCGLWLEERCLGHGSRALGRRTIRKALRMVDVRCCGFHARRFGTELEHLGNPPTSEQSMPN